MDKSEKIIILLVVLTIIILSLVIFSGSMEKSVCAEEHMHCTTGFLQSEGKMVYRDFSYPGQSPYLPLVYAGLFKVLGTTHYLLVGRIFSVFCDIVVAVCIIGIYRRVLVDYKDTATVLGLAGAVLYVFNPFVDNANGFAWNQDFVMACIVGSFWLFVCIEPERGARHLLIGLIGFFMTLATFMQMIMVLAEGLFVVMLLLRFGGPFRKRLKNVFPFLIGMGVVLIWPVVVLFSAPRAFFINQFWMPMHYAAVINKAELLFSKTEMCLSSFTIPGGILVVVIAVFLCIGLVYHRRKLIITEGLNALLGVLLFLISFLLILILPIIRVDFFGRMVPFLIISFAYPLYYFRMMSDVGIADRTFRTACIIITACVVSAIGCQSDMLLRVDNVFKPQRWVPIQMHKVAVDISGRSRSPKPVATLAPLYALEGGLNFYTELSAGPFAYRIAGALTEADIKTTHTISREKLKAQLAESLPSVVILTSPAKSVELVLLRIAKREWPEQYYDKELWERRPYDNVGIVVYIKRDEYYTSQCSKVLARQ